MKNVISFGGDFLKNLFVERGEGREKDRKKNRCTRGTSIGFFNAPNRDLASPQVIKPATL